ncbi:uncharacterized protein LOC141665619 [Apium graveolens]|uniref:uncharacterized protein LOC141665619 n=1 Tax=Apium graveolens TaxID=4045 RepID=UPI003D79F5D2
MPTLFKILKKVKNFEYTSESQEAFKQLKKYMIEAPLLSKPSLEDIFYLYLAVSEQDVSVVLVKEEQKLQKPGYYMSKVLHGAELNYSTTEKPKSSGRLKKLAIELGEFNIKYNPRTAIKAQALAEFVVECIISNQEVGGQKIVTLEGEEKEKYEGVTLKEYWVLHYDRASKTKSSGAGLVLQSPEAFMIEYALKLDFPNMNNEAKYEVSIDGLDLDRAMMAKNLKICGDLRLVFAQVNEEFDIKDDTVAKYLGVIKGILTQFDECYGEHVPRGENTTVDNLSKFTSSEIKNYPRSILITDNERQFDNAEFKEYRDDNSIELHFTSVAHPQANGKT